jgi:anthranilate synthase component 2
MILLLDNHDSFTWNLVELLRSLGKFNDNIVTSEVFRISDLEHYDRIIFSPGPGLPEEQPAMSAVLNNLERVHHEQGIRLPLLGVCLGMQAIAKHFGGLLYQQDKVVHGQPRKLNLIHPSHSLFRGIEQGTTVGLYHSWAVERKSLPDCLEILAESEDGTIMAISHRTLPICGVQFHPESIITVEGKKIMSNWLS